MEGELLEVSPKILKISRRKLLAFTALFTIPFNRYSNAQLLWSGIGVAAPVPFPSFAVLIARYKASNVNNTTEAVLNQVITFDTVNGYITSAVDLKFPPKSGTLGQSRPMKFTTTGTLPTEVNTIDDYYIEETGVGTKNYYVYPAAVDADAGTIPGTIAGENEFPGQWLSMEAGKLMFATAGTGTHRAITEAPGLTLWADISGNGYDASPVVANDRHAQVGVITDGSGETVVDVPGVIELDNTFGTSGNEFGIVYGMTVNQAAARAEVQDCRMSLVTAVLTNKLLERRCNRKTTMTQAGIDTTTNIFTKAAHAGITGDKIYITAYSAGATMPTSTPSWQANWFINRIDVNSFTLHPTKADADANTNIVDITNAGNGTFSLIWPEYTGGSYRAGDTVEWASIAQNVGALALWQRGPVDNISMSAPWTVSGGNNGNISGIAAFNSLEQIDFWFPPGATQITRQVNGGADIPLASGSYWVTSTGASRRLHETLASAQASVGMTTASLGISAPGATGAVCIKYSAQGRGAARVGLSDAFVVNLGAGSDGFNTIIPNAGKRVVSMLIDFNPAADAFPRMWLYINGALIETLLTSTAKGLLTAPVTGTWNLFNSIARHAAYGGHINEFIMHLSRNTDVITEANVLALQAYAASAYTLTP